MTVRHHPYFLLLPEDREPCPESQTFLISIFTPSLKPVVTCLRS